MSGDKVFGLFADVGRNDCLRAVSRAVLRAHSDGDTFKEIGRALGCDAATVENAAKELHLLNFAQIAKLAATYPDTAPIIEGLWNGAVSPAPSPSERIERAMRELRLAEKELGT